ncbi:Monocarboxylate transporter 14 [Armadillidium vulgare]|nr:Monocarboxylate transporter 14 [Armadillidium vulgare]
MAEKIMIFLLIAAIYEHFQDLVLIAVKVTFFLFWNTEKYFDICSHNFKEKKTSSSKSTTVFQQLEKINRSKKEENTKLIATGMNFVYSGQIISLAQYFQRRHSLATSASMVGIGVGVFFMIRFLDYIIMEYGWRGSFIFCAGISLHICIFGSLIFPFKNMESEPENTVNEFKQTFSQVSMAPSLSQAGHSTVINRKYVLNRSVSSLKLSIGAGYLSSSISNLDMDCKSVYGTVKPSQFLAVSLRRISKLPKWIIVLNKTKSKQFLFTGFMDLHHFLYNHPLPSLKDVDKDDIDRLSSILENNTEQENLPSKIDLVEGKLVDPCLLLINITMFFTMLATMKLFVIYKDLSKFLGVEDYYSIAMSTVGIGDILGRISAGFLSSYKCIDSVLAYAIAMILCGIAIAFHICATWGPMFPLLTGLFGFFYGQQNVFITIVPAILFGRENLVSVFGYILFFAGLGALVGTPLAVIQ